MGLTFTRFAVIGLHGKSDVVIPIYDNRLILVGVNGLGKTTVVNLIYFTLTAQWARLLETEFASIQLTLNERQIELSRQDIQGKINLADRYEKVFTRSASRLPYPPRLIQRVVSHPDLALIYRMPLRGRERAAFELSKDIDVPPSIILRMLTEMPKSLTEDLFESTKDPAAISDLLDIIKQNGNQQVIYLPTYRRIEQDLKSIFPNLDEDELRKLTSRSDSLMGSHARGHVELVQFGMHDVEKKIDDELKAIRERTRTQLANLTASYLKDIISNRADAVETELLRKLDEKTVTAVLDRVEENTLSQADKREVRSALTRIQVSGGGFDVRDKYLGYFFSRLLMIYVSQTESERNIRRLIATCNRYFERKAVVYDEVNLTASVIDSDGAPLNWRVLSSGEKQVASLFTHLYLSKDQDQAVIIDEPELSLSVQWQKTLLPDISDSENCKLLIAVTHSPFIYSNKLQDYAVDLAKFITGNSQS